MSANTQWLCSADRGSPIRAVVRERIPTFITRLVAAAGLQWKIISRPTGHKNPEMVSHYNRPGEEQFAADMERYDRHLRLVS